MQRDDAGDGGARVFEGLPAHGICGNIGCLMLTIRMQTHFGKIIIVSFCFSFVFQADVLQQFTITK